MADFSSFQITDVGKALESSAHATGTLIFTKFILGDGVPSSSISSLTSLVNPIMELPVSRLRAQNTKFVVGFDLSSKDVTNGFYLREIGIYAKDSVSGNDVLVFYGNSGDTADYIESKTSATMTEKMIDIEMYISDIASITAEIDSSLVYATQDEMDELATQLVNLNNRLSSYLPLTGGTISGSLTASSGFIGNLTGNCSGSSASCTGNSATATKLGTARQINGTNFDGSGNITTSKWGTARTIGLSGAVSGSASVDGSGNVTITTSQANIAVITGDFTAAANKGAVVKTISYPSGYTKSNCVVLAYGAYSIADVGYAFGHHSNTISGTLFGLNDENVALSNNIEIWYNNTSSESAKIHYKLVLMKVS